MDTKPGNDPDVLDMEQLAAGQEKALDRLMERHASRLFHYLLRHLHNAPEAADLAQETFIRVFLNRTQYQPRYHFTTWLYSIATHLLRDQLRRQTRHPHFSLETEADPPGGSLMDSMASAAPTPRDALEADERVQAVRKAVGSLTEELRLPLILATYQNQTQKEIALILNCSPKAVEMRLYRARQQLHRLLGPFLKED